MIAEASQTPKEPSKEDAALRRIRCQKNTPSFFQLSREGWHREDRGRGQVHALPAERWESPRNGRRLPGVEALQPAPAEWAALLPADPPALLTTLTGTDGASGLTGLFVCRIETMNRERLRKKRINSAIKTSRRVDVD